tara:strand:- start:655 stop:1044 length:390 start_codon:yes stop_codon:yes gene_type:complete
LIAMNWKDSLLFGSLNGAMMAVLMIVNVISRVTDGASFEVTMLSFLVVILIPPFLLKKFKSDEISLIQLIPVSFLTFILPVFGAVLGGPDMGFEWLVLIPMAALGGAIWSFPFAGWNYYKNSRIIFQEE